MLAGGGDIWVAVLVGGKDIWVAVLVEEGRYFGGSFSLG